MDLSTPMDRNVEGRGRYTAEQQARKNPTSRSKACVEGEESWKMIQTKGKKPNKAYDKAEKK